MKRGVDILLGEILEAVELLERYTKGLTYQDFATDIEKQDAVIRRLEIIGEAVKGLPDELRSKYPGVPWGDIAGTRDIMIHEYFRIDLELAWEMVQDDLPPLAAEVRSILAEQFPPDDNAVQ